MVWLVKGLTFIVLSLLAAVRSEDAKEEGRVLSSLLGGSDSCLYRGLRYQCTVSFGCWLSGGRLESGCGNGHLLTEWLFACCVPGARGSGGGHGPPPSAPSQPPLRRADKPYHLSKPHRQHPLHRHHPHHQPAHLHKKRNYECGVPVLQLQKRIIGGDEAYFGELPWQAHLRISGYQCGGVLVSKYFVATAAHCIHRAQLKDILVYLGEYDTQNTGHYTEPYPEEVHRVVQKIVHPNFQYRVSQPDRFDVALVRLSKGVIFKENILPICLPKKNTSFKGKTAVVAGWGKTDTSYGKTGTNILQKATVPILSDDECLEWHRHKNIQVELHKEMFCAGHSDGRMDACLGDSGGPLIVEEGGRWTLAGITSAGFGCAVDHQPGIYHKIQLTRDWMISHINNP